MMTAIPDTLSGALNPFVCPTPERLTEAGATLFKGFTLASWYEVQQALPAGFTERKRWADERYRVVWVSRDYLAIVTFAEGDVHITVSPDLDTFENELDRHAEFYRKMGA